MPEVIFDNEHLIKSVCTIGENFKLWNVGERGITKIIPYREAGQMAHVPWLAIYRGDNIVLRVNCIAVEFIEYDV